MTDFAAGSERPGGEDRAAALQQRRVQYETAGLDVDDLDPDPVRQWWRWHDAAEESGVAEPNAAVVATVDASGVPDARILLVRAVDGDGLVFYTNYASAKSRQLDTNPLAAAVFSWLDLHRQVRVRGVVERVSAADSDAYFASRPRDSQIGAWASAQSTVISGRDALERRVAEVAARHEGAAVPRPDFWGGWRLRPDEWEFWQGRPNRLHDRLRYRRPGPGVAAPGPHRPRTIQLALDDRTTVPRDPSPGRPASPARPASPDGGRSCTAVRKIPRTWTPEG